MAVTINKDRNLLSYFVKSDNHIYFGFLLISFLFRFLTFFYSVIDFDESTYLLIGKELFNGSILYVDYIDTKPPGIFLLYGLADFLTGSGMFVMRLLAALTLALSAFYLYKLKYKFSGNKGISALSGLLYIILVSSYRFGYAANTEIFFNFFNIAALLIFSKQSTFKAFFLGGFLAGLGFVIKYVALFDFTAWWVYILILLITGQQKKFGLQVLRALTAFSGFLIPFILVLLYYSLSGHLTEMMELKMSFFTKYQSTEMMRNYTDMLLDIHLKYLPAFLGFYFVLIYSFWFVKKKPALLFGIIWALFAVLSIVMQKKPYTHYFIQLFPAMAFVFVDLFVLPNKAVRHFAKHKTTTIGLVIILLFIISIVNQSYYLTRKDYPRAVSEYIKTNKAEADKVFVYNYKGMVYYFLDQKPMSKYVHQTMLTYDYHIKSMNIDVDGEIKKIIDQKPSFIITRSEPSFHSSTEYFQNNYELDTVFNKNIRVYTVIE